MNLWANGYSPVLVYYFYVLVDSYLMDASKHVNYLTGLFILALNLKSYHNIRSNWLLKSTFELIPVSKRSESEVSFEADLISLFQIELSGFLQIFCLAWEAVLGFYLYFWFHYHVFFSLFKIPGQILNKY